MRAAFAQFLIASLDKDAEVEEAWATGIERRVAGIDAGTMPVIPVAHALTLARPASATQ